MRSLLLSMLCCGLCACSSQTLAKDTGLLPKADDIAAGATALSDHPTVAETQRLENHRAWQEHGATLAQEHPREWVLISGGEVKGTWKHHDPAWKAANALPETVLHAYLYRAGVDDLETVFKISPFMSQDPHWVQLGVHARRPWKLTISAVGNGWHRRDGKSVYWGDMEALLRLENVAGTAQHQVRAVASNSFEQDLTLRPADAKALGLGRFTAPQPAYMYNREKPCIKVVLRIRVPELDLEAPAVAYVLPEDEVRGPFSRPSDLESQFPFPPGGPPIPE